jgi:hypothetical protein
MQEISSDIIAGRYTGLSGLPTVKELAERYGAGLWSTAKALLLLKDMGIIAPYRRRYRIHSITPTKSSASIVFIADPALFAMTGRSYQDTRVSIFLAALQSACSARKLNLIHVPREKGKPFHPN